MIEHLKQWIAIARSKVLLNRRVGVSLAAVVLSLGIYALSKGEEANSGKVLTSREGEFKRSRILGDPYATTGRAKEQLLNKTAKEYSEAQKSIGEGLTRLEGRLNDLEGKLSSLNQTQERPESTATPSPGISPAGKTPGPTPIGNADRATRVDGTREALDIRPRVSSSERRMSIIADDMPLKTPKGPPVITFPVQGKELRERAEVVLPVGSYVKAKLLTGVEAPEGNPYPVLLQLDFANILPNKKSLDLRGCFMIAKAQGDLSTERVQMQATKLSCVARDGHMFERDINGFVADAVDNSFAVIGTVNTKQDRVAAMAFLSSVVEGVGHAIQMAQTSEQTSPEGVTRRQLTGDQGKYIAAGGASTAASQVAQWYLKQAQNLLPTINVGSGQDVWVIMNESAALPTNYFQKIAMGENHGKDYSFVNRLLD